MILFRAVRVIPPFIRPIIRQNQSGSHRVHEPKANIRFDGRLEDYIWRRAGRRVISWPQRCYLSFFLRIFALLMDETACVTLLLRHGVKPTSNRIVIVKALAAAGQPMTVSELENRIITIDKSGIFRSITLFRRHHLVHSIEDGEGAMRYELCWSHGMEEDEDAHVHFYCTCCHRVYCLHDLPLPSVDLPSGYVSESCNYLVKGLCPVCARRSTLV